jgi:acyl carrier protein
MNSHSFLLEYFVKREGESIVETIYDLDLIESGLLDSLDLIEISEIILEKTGIQLDLNQESTFIAMRKISTLVDLIEKSTEKQ